MAQFILHPSGQGTRGTWTSTGAGTTNLDDYVDDYIGGGSHDSDTTYVEGPNNADSSLFLLLDDVPSGFDPSTITAIEIRSAYRKNEAGVSNGADTVALFYQVFRSDETTAITTELSKGTITSTTYAEATDALTGTGTHTETDWNGARLRIRQDYTVSGCADTTTRLRVSAVEIIVKYDVVQPLAGTLRHAARALGAALISTVALAGTTMATPARMVGEATAPTAGQQDVLVREGSDAYIGSTAFTVSLSGTLRHSQRLTGALTQTGTLAGTLRATPARMVGEATAAGEATHDVLVREGSDAYIESTAFTVSLSGTLRHSQRLTGALTQTGTLAGTLRATPARLVGEATAAGEATHDVLIREGADAYIGSTAFTVSLAGTARHSQRLTGALTFSASTAIAGTLRATPARLTHDAAGFASVFSIGPQRATSARLTGTLRTYVALAGTVRHEQRLPGAMLTQDVPLAGTIRGTTARLTGALATDVALQGTLRHSQRLIGALGTTQALQGTVRTHQRLTGATLAQDTALTGTVRHSQRLTGALSDGATTQALAGTLRGTSARLTGALTTDLALAGTVRHSQRLTGAIVSDLALAGTVRHGARLTGAIGAGVPLAGTVRHATRVPGAGLTQATALAGTSRSTPARLSGQVVQDMALAGTLISGARLPGATLGDAVVAPPDAFLTIRFLSAV